MDPSLNALAHKLRFEMLEEAYPDRARKSVQGDTLLHRLGSLLVRAGQKLQAQTVSENGSYALLDHDVCL